MRLIDSNYLKRTAESPQIRALKNRCYELLRLEPGSSVIDVGCGPAIDTILLAERVGPSGEVVGIDADATMIQEANTIALSEGVGAWTKHMVGDATSLMFADNKFDACFSERLLQHLTWPNARKAVDEMYRVVRPKGTLVVVDTDWATFSISALDPWLERRIIQEHILGFAQPFSGRHLLGLFRSAGAVDISTELFDLQLTPEAVEFLLAPTLERSVGMGRIDIRDADRWYHDLRASKDYGLFFAHLSMVLVTGRKP